MTLQKKWDEIKRLIEERTKAFISSRKGLPTIIYEVTPNGQLIEKPVVKVIHYNNEQRIYFAGKKPSREDVKRVESIFYNLVLDEKYLRFRYDECNSYNMEQINMYNLFLDKSQAEAKCKEITERIAEEERLLSGGDHDRCQRCKKVVPKSQIVSHTIIGRGRKALFNSWKNRYEDKAVVTQELMNFCSGECAGNEQMSREG
jgi:hypothetical protein